MTLGRARAIFDNIENASESIEEKYWAIRLVLDMETHNSVTKASMLKVMNWMWNQSCELTGEGEQ